MGYFVLATLIIILAGAGFLVGRALTTSTGTLISVGSLVAGVILLALATAFATFHTVENGHIGIVKRFGVLTGTKEAGVATIAPWEELDQVTIKNELRDYDMTGGNSAVSSDSQDVFLKVQVNYQLQRDKAVDLYRETGGDFVHRILDPAVYQNTKAVTARYKAINFAANRDAIRRGIEEAIQEEVGAHGLEILNVSLRNVAFTPEFSKAIEGTVTAQQNARRAEAEVKQKEAEARQLIAEARGQARAQRLRQRTLTPLLIQQQAIEKLNPNVQLIICPPRTVCIPNSLPTPGTPREGE